MKGGTPGYENATVLLQLAYEMFHGKAITSRYIRDKGITRATAGRYLRLLETSIPGVEVTGGIVPGSQITLRMRRMENETTRPTRVTETAQRVT